MGKGGRDGDVGRGHDKVGAGSIRRVNRDHFGGDRRPFGKFIPARGGCCDINANAGKGTCRAGPRSPTRSGSDSDAVGPRGLGGYGKILRDTADGAGPAAVSVFHNAVEGFDRGAADPCGDNRIVLVGRDGEYRGRAVAHIAGGRPAVVVRADLPGDCGIFRLLDAHRPFAFHPESDLHRSIAGERRDLIDGVHIRRPQFGLQGFPVDDPVVDHVARAGRRRKYDVGSAAGLFAAGQRIRSVHDGGDAPVGPGGEIDGVIDLGHKIQIHRYVGINIAQRPGFYRRLIPDAVDGPVAHHEFSFRACGKHQSVALIDRELRGITADCDRSAAVQGIAEAAVAVLGDRYGIGVVGREDRLHVQVRSQRRAGVYVGFCQRVRIDVFAVDDPFFKYRAVGGRRGKRKF
ncbi:hypothetical protein SDC9_42746 [bioreactor metagenome]|uniref:Uncharacterized protein n=1 Tax=bioreactor metagenome TaxID=1076179 RepID=A0A644VYK1_9ZZZZ